MVPGPQQQAQCDLEGTWWCQEISHTGSWLGWHLGGMLVQQVGVIGTADQPCCARAWAACSLCTWELIWRCVPGPLALEGASLKSGWNDQVPVHSDRGMCSRSATQQLVVKWAGSFCALPAPSASPP